MTYRIKRTIKLYEIGGHRIVPEMRAHEAALHHLAVLSGTTDLETTGDL
jgi:enoyl reductase-like protein